MHARRVEGGASHVVLLASHVDELSIKLEEAYQDKAYQRFKTVQVMLMSKGATF